MHGVNHHEKLAYDNEKNKIQNKMQIPLPTLAPVLVQSNCVSICLNTSSTPSKFSNVLSADLDGFPVSSGNVNGFPVFSNDLNGFPVSSDDLVVFSVSSSDLVGRSLFSNCAAECSVIVIGGDGRLSVCALCNSMLTLSGDCKTSFLATTNKKFESLQNIFHKIAYIISTKL